MQYVDDAQIYEYDHGGGGGDHQSLENGGQDGGYGPEQGRGHMRQGSGGGGQKYYYAQQQQQRDAAAGRVGEDDENSDDMW